MLLYSLKDITTLQRVQLSMHGILSDISKNERQHTMLWQCIREEFEARRPPSHTTPVRAVPPVPPACMRWGKGHAE